MTENPNSEIDSEKWANEFIGKWRDLANALVSEISDKPEYNIFPSTRINLKGPSTMERDLVEVKPMSAPTGMLFYADTSITYTDEEQIEMNAEKWMRANIEWETIRTNQTKQ